VLRSGAVVVYRIEDHIGTLRRLLIDFVDTSVAGIVSLVLSWIVITVTTPIAGSLAMLAIWTTVWTLYFVVLKGSRYRTLGYVAAGARIVNLDGERPRYLPLLGRLAFALLGPFNFVVDLLWISSDPRRQALRDKVAHTYVIRKNAEPVGRGRGVYRVYTVFGMTLLFLELESC
jgi:uncharacterized RDD family membrane protein YckC